MWNRAGIGITEAIVAMVLAGIVAVSAMAAISTATASARRSADVMAISDAAEAALHYVVADGVRLRACLAAGSALSDGITITCVNDPLRAGLVQVTATAAAHGRIELVTRARIW